ncbi:cell division protein FtsN [Citrobacter freundii]|uniref:cell division protein FtsN n=1 Tax=Citrobacter freundii TaxID=546 RepID=UPI0032C17919
MAQRDYVRRGQPAPSRRKKSTSRKKQRNTPAVSPAMVAIAAAVLVTFIGGLYFITHHKKEESETLQNQKVTGNGIPPKPEERWRYIKELESRQPGVRAPTEPSAGGEVLNADQLTNEQRQRQVQQQQWANTQQQAQQPRTQPRVAEQPYQQPQTRTAQTAPVQQPKAQPKPAAQQPYQDLLQTPAHTTAAQPKTQPAAPITNETQPPKQTAEKKDERRWMVQCGSFKGAEQAETVRAQLAFEGFNSRITTNNGWNRVVIGPVKGKENADNTISRLKVAGHTNCIRLATGG